MDHGTDRRGHPAPLSGTAPPFRRLTLAAGVSLQYLFAIDGSDAAPRLSAWQLSSPLGETRHRTTHQRRARHVHHANRCARSRCLRRCIQLEPGHPRTPRPRLHRARSAGYNRSLIGDAAYIRQFVEGIDEPVILAGHSYGGAVVGIAGMAENVIGLVCVSGYVPAEGETLGQLQARFPDSPLAPNLVLTPVETANGQVTDVLVKIEEFPSLFALGVDPAVAEVLAVSQRPLASVVFEEVAPVSAWTSKPSWGIVSAADRTINPDVERFGYERAGFRGVVELDAPHLVMQTHPKDVADVIENAITATAAYVRVRPAPQNAEREASGFRPSSAPVSGHR